MYLCGVSYLLKIKTIKDMQSNLRRNDTLGTTLLSLFGRLSFSGRFSVFGQFYSYDPHVNTHAITPGIMSMILACMCMLGS